MAVRPLVNVTVSKTRNVGELGAASSTTDLYIPGKLGIANDNPTRVLDITGNAYISSTVGVGGAATFSSTVHADGAVTCDASGTGLSVTNNATVGGTMGVTGTLYANASGTALSVANNATVGGTLGVTGTLYANASGTALSVANNATVGGTIGATGTIYANGTGTALSVANNATVGGTLTATGAVYANGGIDRSTGAALTIGGTNATSVVVGKSGIFTYIAGNLQVNGAETVVGTTEFQNSATFLGNVTIGDGTGTDILAFDATSGRLGSASNPNVIFLGTTAHDVFVDTAAAKTTGSALTVYAATGGAASAGAAGAGGAFTAKGGTGGAATSTSGDTAGAGGSLTITGGTGGAGAATVNGPGAGGNLVISGGSAGAANGVGGANGGDVTINGGTLSGTGAAGSVLIANTTGGLYLGRSSMTANVTGNLAVGEGLTVTGATTLNGNVTLGDASSDVVTINGAFGGNIVFSKEANHQVYVAASTNAATVGGNLTLQSGNGNGAAAGAVLIDSGTGSAGGALTIGGTNAASVGIGHSGVTTTITGSLTQTTGAISLTGNAASNVKTTTGNLDITAGSTASGALNLTGNAASVWKTSAGNLDLYATASLNLGGTTSTGVFIGRSGINTNVIGNLAQGTGYFSLVGNAVSNISTSSGNLDIKAAASLNLGTATSTGVFIGRSGINTNVTGNLNQSTGSYIFAGNAASNLTTTTGIITISAGTAAAGALNLTGNAASVWKTIAGNLDVYSAASLNLGGTNSTGVFIGRSGINTNIVGNLAQGTGYISLAGNTTSNISTSSGNLNITAAAASTWKTSAGNLNLEGAAGINLNGTAGDTYMDVGVTTANVVTLLSGHTFDGTAGTVKLNSGFYIGATGPASANVTATNLNTLTGGVNADSLHTHSASAATSVTVSLTWSTVSQGAAVYVSSANTVSAAVATAIGTSRVVGIPTATTDVVQVAGIADATFISGLTLTAGDPVYLSKTAGKFTNDVSAFTSGDVVSEVGILTSAGTYSTGDGSGFGKVLLQIKSPRVIA